MSPQTYTFKSSSSYSSRSSHNGQTTGQAYQQSTHSNPSGTRVQTTSQNLGGPPVQETRYFDSEGRQVLEGGRTIGPGSGLRDAGKIQAIEDVRDEEGAK